MVDPRKPSVALVAVPETSSAVLYGLYDVLISVGAVYPDMVGGAPGPELLDVSIVAAEGNPFRCVGGIPVEPTAALSEIEQVDVAVVCDLYCPIDRPPRGHYPREVEWLQRIRATGGLVASVCTGSLILAEAGLLDGRQCAGHWAFREMFREYYPRVEFTESSILNLSSEAEGIVTAGSSTSWQDLALYLIARLCSPEEALHTAKVHLLAGHDDGQLPFAAMTRRIQKSDAVIGRCQEWIAKNYSSPNPVAAMAGLSGLTPRTFARRFHSATGYLPIDYVHAMRIEEAKQIIETESGSLDEVGCQVGYEDPTFFRRLFKRGTGLTPAAYRKKFSAILGYGNEASDRAPVTGAPRNSQAQATHHHS